MWSRCRRAQRFKNAADDGQVALADLRRSALDGAEEGGILDGGDLDGFGDAVEQEREAGEQSRKSASFKTA